MESKFSHLPDISTIQPDRLIKYRVSEDKFSAEVLLPGLSYTDFDQKIGGKVSLWSLVKVFEAARWQGMIHGFVSYPELRRDNAMFLASQTMHLSQEINEMRYAKFFGEKRPLKAYIYISAIGKTSFTIFVDIFDYKSGLKLGSNVVVAVIINRQQRKPARLPELFFTNTADIHLKTVENQTIQRAILPTIPAKSFQYKIKCCHSDSDMNQHITQAAYLKWCSDAAAMGALKGRFSQFKRHIELYPLKCTEFHYIGEALVNDTVIVNVWEGGVSDRVLHFAIQRKGRIIFIMKMEFHDGKLYLWSLAKICESVRAVVWKEGFANFPVIHHEESGLTVFVARQDFTFSPEVHDMRFSEHFGKNKPQRFLIHISHVGKTSYTIYVNWLDSRGVKIGTFVSKIILANKQSRRPVPLPDFFCNLKAHFDKFPNINILRSDISEVPDNAFHFKTNVLHSDCDGNNHVNQATYITWCSNAASAGAVKGHFTQFKTYIELYPVKSMEISHLGEAFLNEEILVNVWECTKEKKCLLFSIEKRGSSVFYMKMTFYSTDIDIVQDKGKMNLWSMSKLFECIRYSVLAHGFGHFDRLKDDEHSIFMASTAYHMTESGNTLNTRLHWGLNFPLHALLNIIYAGSSAFSFEIKLTNHSTGEVFITASMTFVYVDYKTRRPAKFPVWYEDLKSKKDFGPALPRLITPEIPAKVFQYEVRSTYSDIDHNGHVNQSVYVKWCTDAGTEAAIKGLYSGFTQNIGSYPLDSLEIKYIGEGMVDEVFVINTWQDKVFPLILYFAITKEGKLAFIAKLTYKASDVRANL